MELNTGMMIMKVEVVRLHHRALKLGVAEHCMVGETDYTVWRDRMTELLHALLKQVLDASGYTYTLVSEPDNYRFLIGSSDLEKLVERAGKANIELGPMQFVPPAPEQPMIYLCYYDYENERWDAVGALEKLEKDLARYKKLEEEELADAQEESASSAVERKLAWLKQVHGSQVDASARESCTAQVVQALVPETPLRVRVSDGQSLQDALLAALQASAEGNVSEDATTSSES